MIKLKALKFESKPFRKLGDIKIQFAPRITLIAGHNGIGKSTILGLIANGSGNRDTGSPSYLNRQFEANLKDIVHLDYEKDFEAYKGSEEARWPTIEYEINGEQLIKRCSITGRTESRTVRVVPRNLQRKTFVSSDGEVTVGPDAKVPFPTLYLGMTRMLPVGESNPAWVTSDLDKSIHLEDAEFIQTFIDGVIGTGSKPEGPRKITTLGIRGTGKTAKHPDYQHSPKCVSLGQDSLSAIATALASFQMLQREWPEYRGGLLVVDELDAGFHPHAQQKLMKAIGNAAKKLNLQVIATTHSICLIEAIHPDANPIKPPGKHVDAIVYLTDTRKPRLAEDYTLEDIKRDMSLTPHPEAKAPKAKTLKIYLEDAEAGFFLKHILTRSFKERIKREAGVFLAPIPLSVGCENLKGFTKYDPYFKSVLIAVDADSNIIVKKAKPKNIVILPGALGKDKKGLSPERTLFNFVQNLVNGSGDFPIAAAAIKAKKLSSDYLHSHLLEGYTSLANRESAKNWMKSKLDLIEKWDLIGLWLKEHPQQLQTFQDSLVKAATFTAKLL